MKIKRLFYLVHSMIQKYAETENPELYAGGTGRIYREQERRCEERWLNEIKTLEAGAVFAMLYGGRELFDQAVTIVGEDRAFWVSADWSPDLELEVIRQRLSDSLVRQLDAAGHSIDPDFTTLELGGESFEGCVNIYGTALARHLRLRNPLINRFEMCVPDARFLCNAELTERFMIPDSPVAGYIFESVLAHPVGWFMDCFWTEGQTGYDVVLNVNPTRIHVCNKNGITLYSNLHLQRGDREIPLGPGHTHESVTITNGKVRIGVGGDSMSADKYILSPILPREEFYAAMRNARVIHR